MDFFFLFCGPGGKEIGFLPQGKIRHCFSVAMVYAPFSVHPAFGYFYHLPAISQQTGQSACQEILFLSKQFIL